MPNERRPSSRPDALTTTGIGTPRDLIERILDTPRLARAVPRLAPEVLHQLVRHCGLEASAPLLELTTPAQLAGVFDLDLWRPATGGGDERLDAGRFGEWLEVMLEGGADAAAARLAALDADLVSAAFAQHVRVVDRAVLEPYVSLEGVMTPTGYHFGDGPRCEAGGYVIIARRADAWEAVAAVLTAFAATPGDAFARVMRACVSLSDVGREADGFHDLLETGDQALFELATDREARRETQGYVAPADARAFLLAARRTAMGPGSVKPTRPAACPPSDASEADVAVPRGPAHESPEPSASAADPEDVVAVVDLLRDAGVVAREPVGLLPAARDSGAPIPHLRQRLQQAADRDLIAFATLNADLAFLANALVAGTSILSRRLEPDEASAAAAAVCNLGLARWPAHWPAGDGGDLVAAFHVGWTVLHEEVCAHTADRLATVLASLRVHDVETDAALRALRSVLTRHLRAGTPWHARAALEAIAILDPVSWAALTALIDEFPVLPEAVRASLTGSTRQVSPTAFEFIASDAQVRVVHAFVDVLAERLRR